MFKASSLTFAESIPFGSSVCMFVSMEMGGQLSPM